MALFVRAALLATALVGSSDGLGLNPLQYENEYTFPGSANMKIYYTCNVESDELSVLIEGTGDNWYGIGFVRAGQAATMDNSDMAIGKRDASGLLIIEDRHGRSKPPTYDAIQSFRNMSAEAAGNILRFAFTRNLISGLDVDDGAIARGPSSLVWARGLYDSGNTLRGHNNGGGARGSVSDIELCPAPDIGTTVDITTSLPPEFHRCASEASSMVSGSTTCDCNGTVAFGAGVQWVYIEVNDSIRCRDDEFGDPFSCNYVQDPDGVNRCAYYGCYCRPHNAEIGMSTSTASETTTVTTTMTTTGTTTSGDDGPTLSPPAGIARPTVTNDGYIDLTSVGTTYPRVPGLEATYFDYSAFPHVVEQLRGARDLASENWFHTREPDFGGVVSNVDFPGHVRHYLGSPYREYFSSQFSGYIEIPVSGTYSFSALCSDGCYMSMDIRDPSRDVWSSNNYILSQSQLRSPDEASNRGPETYDLEAGLYNFSAWHSAGPNDLNSTEDLRARLGYTFQLFWDTPFTRNRRIIPPSAFSHAPIVSADRASRRFVVEHEMTDGNFSSRSHLSWNWPWDSDANNGISPVKPYGRIDLGWSCDVSAVEVIAERRDYGGSSNLTVWVGSEPIWSITGASRCDDIRYFDHCTTSTYFLAGSWAGDCSRTDLNSEVVDETGCIAAASALNFTYNASLSNLSAVDAVCYRDGNRVLRINTPPVVSSTRRLCSPHPICFGDRREVFNCSTGGANLTGRYIFIKSESSIWPQTSRTYVNEVFVKGIPQNPPTPPPLLTWPAPETRRRVIRPHSQYRVPLAGHNRVYVSLVQNETHAIAQSYLNEIYYGGRYALDEMTLNDDGRRWQLDAWTSRGSLVLDMGFEHPISAIRLLNMHGSGGLNSGAKDVRIEVGSSLDGNINVAAGASASTWHQAVNTNPDFAVDGDPTTCFRIPGNESGGAEDDQKVLLIDLGAVYDARDVIINTGRNDLHNMRIYLSSNFEDSAPTPIPPTNFTRYMDWNVANIAASSCSGQSNHYIRYGEQDTSYYSRYFYPSYDEVRLPCLNRGRYLTIRADGISNNLTICDIKVMANPSANWTTVDSFRMNYTGQYYRDTTTEESTSENGVGPWTTRFFAPVTGRYVRINIDSRYKTYAGLASVEVWSSTPVPKYQIMSTEHLTNSDTRQGLLMEFYQSLDNFHIGRTWESLQNTLDTARVRADAIIPTVDLAKRAQDWSNGDDRNMTYSLNVTQEGTKSIGNYSGNSMQVTVTFPVPFPMMPNITARLHRKYFDTVLYNTSVVAAAAGFVVTVDSYTTDEALVSIFHPTFPGSFPEISIEWGGISFFPPMSNTIREVPEYFVSNGRNITDFTRESYWYRQNFHAKITGELVPLFTGMHTLYLVGGPMVRLLINGTQVIAIRAAETQWNDAWIEGSYQIELTEGEAVPIEIQFTTAGRHTTPAAVMLQWSYASYTRNFVPVSALRHRVRAICLAYSMSSSRVNTEECNSFSPSQLFRNDGRFIRPAGDTYTLAAGDLAKRCLSSFNHPWNSTIIDWDVMDCQAAGLYNFYVNRSSGSNCREELLSPAQLWSYDPETTTIRSDCTRPSDPHGASQCQDEYAAACGQTGTDAGYLRTRAYECSVNTSVAPFMCISAGEFSNSRNQIANLDRCDTAPENQRLGWHFIPAVTDRTKTELILGGAYLKTPHVFYDTSRMRSTTLGWSVRIEREMYCRADANNTCRSACNGLCEETSWYGERCATGTDTYDCDPDTVELVCARLCSGDSTCAGFATNGYGSNNNYARCYFYSELPLSTSYWMDPHMTIYAKQSDGVSDDIVEHTAACTSWTNSRLCSSSQNCRWIPRGEADPLSGLSIEDPECSDAGSDQVPPRGHGMTCAQYKAADLSEMALGRTRYASAPLHCNKHFVAQACPVTCASYIEAREFDQYCSTVDYVCTDIESEGSSTPLPTPEATCLGGGIIVENRCRCPTDTSCRDGGSEVCSTFSAGNNNSVASWYPPACSTCMCIRVPATMTPTVAPTPNLRPRSFRDVQADAFDAAVAQYRVLISRGSNEGDAVDAAFVAFGNLGGIGSASRFRDAFNARVHTQAPTAPGETHSPSNSPTTPYPSLSPTSSGPTTPPSQSPTVAPFVISFAGATSESSGFSTGIIGGVVAGVVVLILIVVAVVLIRKRRQPDKGPLAPDIQRPARESPHYYPNPTYSPLNQYELTNSATSPPGSPIGVYRQPSVPLTVDSAGSVRVASMRRSNPLMTQDNALPSSSSSLSPPTSLGRVPSIKLKNIKAVEA